MAESVLANVLDFGHMAPVVGPRVPPRPGCSESHCEFSNVLGAVHMAESVFANVLGFGHMASAVGPRVPPGPGL